MDEAISSELSSGETLPAEQLDVSKENGRKQRAIERQLVQTGGAGRWNVQNRCDVSSYAWDRPRVDCVNSGFENIRQQRPGASRRSSATARRGPYDASRTICRRQWEREVRRRRLHSFLRTGGYGLDLLVVRKRFFTLHKSLYEQQLLFSEVRPSKCRKQGNVHSSNAGEQRYRQYDCRENILR